MVYRTPAPPTDDERILKRARLESELAYARRRAARLLQCTGFASVFLCLKIAAIGWIPAGVVRLGTSLWAGLMLVSGLAVLEAWRIGRERKRA